MASVESRNFSAIRYSVLNASHPREATLEALAASTFITPRLGKTASSSLLAGARCVRDPSHCPLPVPRRGAGKATCPPPAYGFSLLTIGPGEMHVENAYKKIEFHSKLAWKRPWECIYTAQSCKHRHCLNNSLLLRTILSVLLHYRSMKNSLLFPYFKYLLKKEKRKDQTRQLKCPSK